MRPIAVSELILRANCWRLRTVSDTMSKSVGERAADLALDRHGGDREPEVLRAERGRPCRASASSIGRPRPASVEHALQLVARRRLASSSDRLEPVLERVARLQRRRDRRQQVGQLILERLRRGGARGSVTKPYGSRPPIAMPTSAISGGGAGGAEDAAPRRRRSRCISQTNSAGRSGTSPRTSSRSIDRHFACAARTRPRSPGRAPSRNESRSPCGPAGCVVCATCGASRCSTQLPRPDPASSEYERPRTRRADEQRDQERAERRVDDRAEAARTAGVGGRRSERRPARSTVCSAAPTPASVTRSRIWSPGAADVS